MDSITRQNQFGETQVSKQGNESGDHWKWAAAGLSPCGSEDRDESKAPASFLPPEDDTLVAFNTCNFSLLFKVTRNQSRGHTLTIESFAHLWSGACAGHGASRGVCV